MATRRFDDEWKGARASVQDLAEPCPTSRPRRERRFHLAADSRIRIVAEPQLSVVCFAVEGGEAAGQKLMHDILEDGFLMLSTSRVRGEYVLRFCVLNHRTTEQDIRDSVDRILLLMS